MPTPKESAFFLSCLVMNQNCSGMNWKWVKVIVFYVFLMVLSITSLAQTSDSISVSDIPSLKFTKEIATSRLSHLPFREEIAKTLAWNWTNLGPNIQPIENRPGGKALPTYAINRGNGTGRINYLCQHPKFHDILFACSPTGGAWVSFDQGNNWTIAGTDRLNISGVSSISPDAKKKDRWWLATGDGDDVFQFTDGVWMTNDGGISYQNINGKIPGKQLPFGDPQDFYGQISDVKSNPKYPNQLFVASNRGLYVTRDARFPEILEWEKIYDGHFYDIKIFNGKRRVKDFIIASGSHLAWSKNGGMTWELAEAPSYSNKEKLPFVRMVVLWHKAYNDELMVAVTNAKELTQSLTGEGSLYSFNIRTKQWTFIRSLKKDLNNMITTRARAIALDPQNPEKIILGNVQPLFISKDKGNTFSRIEKNQMHDDCHHILFSYDGKKVWASHDGGVSVSKDGGNTWRVSDNGIGAANIFGVSSAQTSSPQVLYGGYDVGGNLLRDSIWSHVSWGDGFETIIHPTDPNIMFTTMQNGNIQKTTDGSNFDEGKDPASAKTEWHTWIDMHPTNHQMVFCAGAKLSRSVDLGSTWQTIFEPAKKDKGLYNAYRFFFSNDHPGAAYVYVLDTTRLAPQIWRTFNVTVTDPNDIIWEKVADLPVKGWIMSIQVDPFDPKQFWVLYAGQERTGKLWRFDGTDYHDETSNLGWSKCESMILQKGTERRLYIGSNYGVFTRRWNESQWTLLTGLPGTQIKSLDINYVANKLVVGTYGRGVWWGDLLQR